MQVGVVILNWNGWRDTKLAIASVRAQAHHDVRIYVVDNGSTDESLTQLKPFLLPDEVLIETGANLGWTGGNNAGIRRLLADGCDAAFLLNNDAQLFPDTLAILVARAQAYPRAGALGCAIYTKPDDPIPETCFSEKNPINGYPEEHERALFLKYMDQPVVPSAHVHGCAIFVPAKVIEKVGYIDEAFFLTADEVDWCYRMQYAGFECLIVPQARVLHGDSVSFQGRSSPLREYFIRRNQLLFIQRHAPRARWLQCLRRTLWTLQLAAAGDEKALTPAWLFARRKSPVAEARLSAVRDFWLRRFGDCPPRIRQLGRA
jgi:GT2 family glycosyltransferase